MNGRRMGERYSNKYGFYALFGLVTYFVWCDLNFFGDLAAESTDEMKSNTSKLISRFTIKYRILAHFDRYINLPLAMWLEEALSLSSIWWMTPNLVTLMHFSIAVVGGCACSSTKLFWRRVAVILFNIRTCLDNLDGVIYRAQRKFSTIQVISGWGTLGYWIDGMADTLGCMFIMVGTVYRYNKYPPLKNPESLLKPKRKYKGDDEESAMKLLTNDDDCSEETEKTYGLERHSRKHAYYLLLFVTIMCVVRSAAWDHYMECYHKLLGVKRPDANPDKQFEVLKYGSTWFCIWLWNFNSADAFISYTLIAMFFNKLWEWIRLSAYAAIPTILMCCLISQIHLMHIRHLLGVTVIP